ncbi:MAG: outer membrane lipoprotein-sorting protein [Pseudomonadota bacterium]
MLRKTTEIARLGALAGAILLGMVINTTAQTAEQKGFEIAARSDRSDRGFGDSVSTMTMILRTASGQEARRSMRQTVLEVPNEKVGDKSVNIFDAPEDVAGTALLSHAKITKADDQWLYLPALKRVKRISSSNKSGPFLGSEFAFEDFTGQELGKFTYKFLKSEGCGSLTCDVIQRIPTYKNSGYAQQIVWIDQRDFQFRRVQFYDRGNALMKTLVFTDYKKYQGKFWRPLTLTMQNHQTGKSTVLRFSDYKFGNGLRDSDFVQGRLSRI